MKPEFQRHLKGLFIESSHVKFLESGGARVVPIDYTQEIDLIKSELESINGLYIPGDCSSLITYGERLEYTKKVQKILLWAQNHNNEANQHFPIMGVGYGFMTLIKS